jgi:hypothetical protein
MKPLFFQIVHYIPNLFVGGRVPIAAVVRDSSGTDAHIVRAEFHPDERCLGGRDHVAMLSHVLARLELEPRCASTAALGPHIAFDEPRRLPAGVEPDEWLREKVLPRVPHEEGGHSPRRATHGYDWLSRSGLARFIRKRFRPEKPEAPQIHELLGKKLKSVSHWVTDGEQVLLLEPIIPSDSPQRPIEDISTVFGAYRFHLGKRSGVTLGVYMLAGGSSSARYHTQGVLGVTAHQVFDTEDDFGRNSLIARIKALGESTPLLH